MGRKGKAALFLFGLILLSYISFRLYRAEEWNVYIGRGTALYQQGKYDLAIHNLRNALRLVPNDGYTHYQIGNAYYKQGQLDEAAAEYQKSLGLTPQNARAHLGLGDVLHDKKEYAHSIAEYKDALRIDPNLKLGRPELSERMNAQ